jgi:hypothetical protein
MGGAELVRSIEEAGGVFAVDGSDGQLVFVNFTLGNAPSCLLPLLEREKSAVAGYLLLRDFIARWQPGEGERVQ